MKSVARFPVVEMSGSHYEMGRQYAAQCGPLVRDLLAKFDRLLLKPEDVEAGKAAAREAEPFVRDAAPELMDEVRGLADGAGLDFHDVFRLNCSVELFAWRGCAEDRSVSTVPASGDGCSSFAARADEGTLVAWNMDWWTVWRPYIVLLHGRPDDAPAFFAFAFAGCVGRPGMSERVAVAANYLPYRGGPAPGRPNAWEGPGIPYCFLSRIILKQRCAADAVAAVVGARRMAGVNYTIGDVSGDIRCLETTPLDHAELRPEDLRAAPARDFLTHANSFLTEKFDGVPEEELPQRDERTAHAREQLASAPRPLDRSALMRVMTSHFPGQTTGICVHRQLGGRPGISLLSFIADLGAGKMWAAVGPPCRHEYAEYVL